MTLTDEFEEKVKTTGSSKMTLTDDFEEKVKTTSSPKMTLTDDFEQKVKNKGWFETDPNRNFHAYAYTCTNQKGKISDPNCGPSGIFAQPIYDMCGSIPK